MAWVILVVCLVSGGILALLMAPDRPVGHASAVLGSFLYYSNDVSGARLAVFSITNQSQLPIRRERYYEVHVRTGASWSNQPTVFQPGFAKGPVVRPGKSEVFTIKAPIVTGPWRLCYPYIEHESWIRRVRAAAGFPSKHVAPSYAGFTGEIAP